MKTLEELVEERETYTPGKGTIFSKAFKQAMVEFHYDSGMSIMALCRELNIHFTTGYEWKRHYGTGQTHAKHGDTTRADLKTKALAVTDELDNGMTTIAIANKYNITRQQYGAWKIACQGRYEEFRKLPDGVMFVTKPEKLIFGDANIRAYREFLNEQLTTRERVLKDIHALGHGHAAIQKEADLLKAAADAVDAAKDIK